MKSERSSKIFLLALIVAISFLHAEKIRSKDADSQNFSGQAVKTPTLSYHFPVQEAGADNSNNLKILK